MSFSSFFILLPAFQAFVTPTDTHISHLLLAYALPGMLVRLAMRPKKRQKTAVHVMMIIVVLALGCVRKAMQFFGGRRSSIEAEANRIDIPDRKGKTSPGFVAEYVSDRRVTSEGEEDVSEERQQMRDLVHFLASAPPGTWWSPGEGSLFQLASPCHGPFAKFSQTPIPSFSFPSTLHLDATLVVSPLRPSPFLVLDDPQDRVDTSERPVRLALCFFGQVKNIEEGHSQKLLTNVIRPLTTFYPQIDLYLHTYNMQSFSNPRNGEHNVTIDVAASLERLITMLREMAPPGRVLLKGLNVTEPIDADRHFRPLEFYLSRGDPWDNEGISMLNLLRQLYSLDQVTQQWEHDKAPDYYTAVIYTRPDLLFHTRLPLVASENGTQHALSMNTLYAAPFDDELGQALNDRFSFGTPDVMRIYGHRMHSIEAYFERYPEAPLWSEKFLHKLMVEMHGFAYTRLENFWFSRVRADGSYQNTR